MTKNEWNGRQGRSSSWIRREKRVAIYIRDGFTCMYCGADLRDAPPHRMGLDHLVPQSNPRCTNHERNLVTACVTCNSARQDKPVAKFAAPGAVKRIRRNVRRKLNIDVARALLREDARWSDR